ncbi:MAG TPA: tRNA pseudouridine(38-40) synthase TruA [Chitinivibrionales bacterium]|nr:tRNA pseudouridine(38-40) synthase TruA [Chitinivibrionales bacterium]
MRYFFRVEYDGTGFGGWQSQTNAPSIQDALSSTFATVLRCECTVTGAGRTDAGVHARAQGAHVDVPVPIDVAKCEHSLNAVLPDGICVYGMQRVADDFHARYSAKKRRYKYYLAERKKPLFYKRVWMVFYDVDWDKVQKNIPLLLGTHDFSAFCSSDTTTENMVCAVSEASLSLEAGNRVFLIAADRFVYKMVRSIVGTLIDIGRGRLDTTIRDIIESKDRKKAGETAPACGLVLDYVEYPGINDNV